MSCTAPAGKSKQSKAFKTQFDEKTGGQVYLDPTQKADGEIIEYFESFNLKKAGFFVNVSRL